MAGLTDNDIEWLSRLMAESHEIDEAWAHDVRAMYIRRHRKLGDYLSWREIDTSHITRAGLQVDDIMRTMKRYAEQLAKRAEEARSAERPVDVDRWVDEELERRSTSTAYDRYIRELYDAGSIGRSA